MAHGTFTPPDVDPAIQDFIDNYGGATYEEYAGEFPHPGSDTKLTTRTLASTPATVSTSTTATLNFVSASTTVLGSTEHSPYTEPKYARITKAAQPDIFLSVGTSDWVNGASSAFGADAQYSGTASTSLEWFSGDTVTVGSATLTAVDETLDHYAVSVSSTTPPASSDYTATATAKDSGGTTLHRIGLSLTASYVATAGGGGGSVAPSTVVTNALGVSETITVTAGDPGTTEHVHVTDGTATGDSVDVSPVATNKDLTITSLWTDDSPAGGSDPLVSASVTIPAGSAMLVGVWSIAHTAPTASGVTFGEPVQVTGGSGGHLSIYNSGKLASGFTGTVSFGTGGGDLTAVIAKAVPSATASAISDVQANRIGDAVSGVAGYYSTTALTNPSIDFPNTARADTHNVLFALWANYGDQTGTHRTGWTEVVQIVPVDFNHLAIEVQSRASDDATTSVTYPVGPAITACVAIELQALP